VRLALVLMFAAATTAHADPTVTYAPPAPAPQPAGPSQWNAEVRLGYGVQITSGDGMTAPRSAPLTIEADAAFLLQQEEPRLFVYAGGIAETLDRSAIGGSGGVELEQGSLRLRGGANYFFAPYTLFGADASVGTCRHIGKSKRGCLDLQVTEFFAGTDLVKGHASTQIQLVLGMAFDGN